MNHSVIHTIHTYGKTLNDGDTVYTPSKERGNPLFQAKVQLEGNKIRTSIFNNGLSGRKGGQFPLSVQTPYEWPKNSGQTYLAMECLLLGAEVIDNLGEKKHIIITSVGRSSPEHKTWNFEPVPGYSNKSQNTVASSTDQLSWPDYWPDKLDDKLDPGWKKKWNGILGKNRFIDGQETFYKMSDDLYDRYPNYFPDKTDLKRKGLGLVVECRSMEFNPYPFEDIVFHYYKIKNDGTNTLKKMGATFWVADYVGGDGDSQDDRLYLDYSKKLIITYDNDNKAPYFESSPVGCFGFSLLKAPLDSNKKELGITNHYYMPAGGFNINSDAQMWFDFLIPDKFIDPNEIVAGEYDHFISSSYFSLDAGKSTEIISAIIMGNGPIDDPQKAIRISEVKRKLGYAKFLLEAGFNPTIGKASITSPIHKQTSENKVTVNWAHDLGSFNVKSDIFFSTDFGFTWKYIGTDSINTNSYTIDLSEFPDGIQNKVKVFSYSGKSYCLTDSKEFVIDRNTQIVSPQVILTTLSNGQTVNNDLLVGWNGGDADGDEFVINLFYRKNKTSDWTLLLGGIKDGIGNYNMETKLYPNSNEAEIKAEIISSNEKTAQIVSGIIINNFYNLPNSLLMNQLKSSNGTGVFEVHVKNMNELTGHDYTVKFYKSSTKKLVYDVINQRTGKKCVIGETVLNSSSESPYFDGMNVVINADSIFLNTNDSKWSSNSIYPFAFEVFSTVTGGKPIRGEKLPYDYQIVFGDLGIGTSKDFMLGSTSFPSKTVNFTVINTTKKTPVEFGFAEIDGNNGIFSVTGANRDRIILMDNVENSSNNFSYWIYLKNTNTGIRIPTKGDTLYIYNHKPFLEGDSISFSTKNFKELSSYFDEEIPDTYFLSQNYPNPFNPSTRISFSVPQKGFVSLIVFNILGQEIATLVREEKLPGRYEVVFDGTKLSSGIYFYRLQADKFVQSRKLVLLK